MSCPLVDDLSCLIRVPLRDLGEIADPAFAGILVPESAAHSQKTGITAQFLDNAEVYHKKYAATAYYKSLLDKAFGLLGNVPADANVLDLGSGAGNTIFPCLELLPQCRIVATDLSPNLLRILSDELRKAGVASGRVAPVCLDATQDVFGAATFDVVVGAAILHHLIDPRLAIRAVANALKPGTSGRFFEPFEAGYMILCIAYAEILRQADAIDGAVRKPWWQPRRGRRGSASIDAIDPSVRSYLENMVADCRLRAATDRSAEIYRLVDDKWLFTRHYLEQCAKECGIREVLTYPLCGLERPFSNVVKTHLGLALDRGPDALPTWAWEILAHYDALPSPDLKHDMPLEACIIFRK